ncbi:MAG: ABC transporter ATP-binding protein [Actinobacteria bacterium]|nr:ABC transporter ATP-binding protein [Actinomycetota bacterium]
MSQSHATPALRVRDLTVRYTDTVAVDNVSFTAHGGTVTAILGRNGAGKTSTIEACEGLRRATSGDALVLGASARDLPASVRARMGVMLQDGGIAPAARVEALIRHYCRLYDRGVDAARLIDRLGGERQRVSLALALAAAPEIAFLDEPTAGVDLDGREVIREIIAELSAAGACVILATHDLDEAERVADHAVVLHRGSVVADGRLTDLCAGGKRLEDVVREVTK